MTASTLRHGAEKQLLSSPRMETQMERRRFKFNTKRLPSHHFIHSQPSTFVHLISIFHPVPDNPFVTLLYKYDNGAPANQLHQVLPPPLLSPPTLNKRVPTPSLTNIVRQREAKRHHESKPANVSMILRDPKQCLEVKKISPLKHPQDNNALRHRANAPNTHLLSNIHRRRNRARSPQERHRTFNTSRRSRGRPS